MKLPYKSLGPLKSTFQILVRPLYLVKRSPAKAKTKDSYFTLSLRPVVHNLHWHRFEMLQNGQFVSACYLIENQSNTSHGKCLDVIHLFSISTKKMSQLMSHFWLPSYEFLVTGLHAAHQISRSLKATSSLFSSFGDYCIVEEQASIKKSEFWNLAIFGIWMTNSKWLRRHFCCIEKCSYRIRIDHRTKEIANVRWIF